MSLLGSDSSLTSTTSIDSNSILSFENSEDFSLDSLFLDQDSSNESPNHMNQTPELNIPHHPESNFVSENPLQEMIPFDWTSTNPWGHQGCGKKKIIS